MTPKELFASKAKLAEQKADRVRKMAPEEKAASMAKHAEQEAERVRKMDPEENAASLIPLRPSHPLLLLYLYSSDKQKMTPKELFASKAKHAE